jgi:FMN phosphatase YigB (HAD superfamily)/DNA-binding XRE family transcriptional regulator
MAMDERGLGKVLQKARQNAGLTQQQLCHKANLSFSTLTKIERGAIKSPSIFTIQAIATALDVSLDQLIGQSAMSTSSRHKLKTKTGVSFVYFDVNGCLVYFYQRAFDKLALDTGVNNEIVESTFWHYNDQVCRGEMSMSDFNHELGSRLGQPNLEWRDYYLATAEPITKMQELLVWASERYRIGLLTNIMPGLVSSMKRNKQLPDIHYDTIIDSSEIGAIKPEVRIYEIAQERANCPANEILLIDDSRVNIVAATRMDWHVQWFDDSHPDLSVERARQALEPAD